MWVHMYIIRARFFLDSLSFTGPSTASQYSFPRRMRFRKVLCHRVQRTSILGTMTSH